MWRCIGSPCRAYLVLRSAMCPLQSPAGHLLRPMPASSFCVPVPVTSGRTGATVSGGKFENLKKVIFFSKHIFHMLCPVLCLHCVCSF
ncbi:unnamed protein product, partial [Staurois parvus]